MTTLHFEAPSDLSVGRVTVTGRSGVIMDWMATPENRRLTQDVAPGFYSAEISPAGLTPQSVIFEVKSGGENRVTVPAFSWLLANTGNVTFLDIENETRAIEALYPEALRPKPDQALKSGSSDTPSPTGSSEYGLVPELPHLDALEVRWSTEGTHQDASSSAARNDRRLSIGLSIESSASADSFRPYAGRTALSLTEGRLQLTVEPLEGAAGPKAGRVRMSVAIERSRIERLFLPFYRGGVLVTISPSVGSALDAELEVAPRDPRLRALSRALVAGTSDEARAILPLLVPDTTDPWEALLAALLSIRFPDTLPALSSRQAKRLVELAPWAYDAHVIQARQRLFGAEPGEDQAVATQDALAMLKKAQTRGSPYFAYSNKVFAELIEALSAYFDRVGPDGERHTAGKVRRRWFREQPLQSGAGVSFSWLRRDPTLAKAGLLAPLRSGSGRLPPAATNVIFQGRLSGDRIQIEPSESSGAGGTALKSGGGRSPHGMGPTNAPAMSRPAGPDEDPNLDRFGGMAEAGGYSLTARFEEQSNVEWASIILTVAADPYRTVAAGGVVWFCLHPTFNPQWVRVMLINGKAELSIESWGGFTVGAWLPDAEVELELDLAKHPLAPAVVRKY